MKLTEIEFDLEGHEHIELKNLLKVCNLCESGGQAKFVIEDGQVRVNGVVEKRKSLKLTSGQVVIFNNHSIKII
jgi:ribosome-associated protein